jgi:hypothetical protein
MWEAAAVVAGALFVSGATVRALSAYNRRRGLALLGDAPRNLEARGVHLRIKIEGARMRGVEPGRLHKRVGDLALAGEHFVLSTGSGVVLDEREGGRTMTSVRCPGPGRLVIEGEVPTATGVPAPYRIELVADDAPAWATALGPLARDGAVVAGPRPRAS